MARHISHLLLRYLLLANISQFYARFSSLNHFCVYRIYVNKRWEKTKNFYKNAAVRVSIDLVQLFLVDVEKYDKLKCIIAVF